MKILREEFHLPRKWGYAYYPWDGSKRFAVDYSDRVNVYFCRDMVYSPVSRYVEEFGYYTEFLSNDVFYIFNDSTDGLKVRVDFNGFKNYEITDYGTVRITQENEVVTKDFITYEELIYAITECFDRFVATGHIKEVQERPKANTEKVRALKLMHGIMQGMNNEDAYYSWIAVGVPDGASEDDYADIALDDNEYNDIVKSFNRIFKRYAKDGLLKPSTEEARFAKEKCRELGISDIEILGESLNKKIKVNKSKKSLSEGWTDKLDGDVYRRLCACRSRKSDIEPLVNAKWAAMKEAGKDKKGFTKEDALVSILELLDENGCYIDLTRDEYDDIIYTTY